ncbi:MAG: shikimate dehydrogenase [Chthoniobacterales bacterium]
MKNFYKLSDLESWTEPPEEIRLGVLGQPVAHSLSPPLQNAALKEADLTMRYARFEISPNELARALDRCAALDFAGVNLTVPHKVAGFSLVNECDAFAQQVGAINTIRFVAGRMRAANTDGPGFEGGIRESFRTELRDLRVLVLGAGGGAGRALAAQCVLTGCARLALANRTFEKAQALAERWNRPGIFAVPWREISSGKALREVDLIVNATPLGLHPNHLSPLPAHLLGAQHLVYDLNYRPTALLAAAAEAGARTASGLTMLLHQGALAFEFWFERDAPIAAMRAALGL